MVLGITGVVVVMKGTDTGVVQYGRVVVVVGGVDGEGIGVVVVVVVSDGVGENVSDGGGECVVVLDGVGDGFGDGVGEGVGDGLGT